MVRPGILAIAGLIVIAVAARWRGLSRHARVIGATLAIALAVYGSGAVHVPDFETVSRALGETFGPYTYVLVGLLAFFETALAIGLVLPGELAVIVGGVSAGQGQISIAVLVVVVWICAFAGDVTSFILGRSLGRGFLIKHGSGFKLTAERVERVETFLARHGGKTIVVGRFIGLVRAMAPFVAGASGMRPAQFIPFACLAAVLWAAAFAALGYVFWQSLDQAVAIAKEGTLALVAVVAATVGLIALYRYLRRQANSAEQHS